jgi:transposase
MFAGVDTHKGTLAVAVIDHAGRVVRQLELPNQDSFNAHLLALLSSHNVVRVGIEGPATTAGRRRSICSSGK